MKRYLATLLSAACVMLAPAAEAKQEFDRAWKADHTSIVLDAYEFTPIEWDKLKENRNLVGFINKASDGLPPKYCGGGDSMCRVKWRRYSVTKELYHTRRSLAKALGMKWGAYHLARPGNPIEQAQHFLRFAKPEADEIIALDLEDDNPSKWMNFADAEIFIRYIKARTGRYPVLYTNHNTAKSIARQKDTYKLLSRLPLWYARFRPEMAGAFPMGHWESYALWQFSSNLNCSKRSCPMRVKGTDPWIDVNVAWQTPDELRAAWPFAELVPERKEMEPHNESDNSMLFAYARPKQVLSQSPAAKAVAAMAIPGRPLRADNLSRRLPGSSDDDAARSAARERGTAMLAALTSFPKWRPGAEIVRRVSVRTADEVRHAIAAALPHNHVPRTAGSADTARTMVASRRAGPARDKASAFPVVMQMERGRSYRRFTPSVQGAS